MLFCSPVEHVPVRLHQGAHEQGVEGAGSDVGLAGGRVTGVEVVRSSRDGRVGKPVSRGAGWKQSPFCTSVGSCRQQCSRWLCNCPALAVSAMQRAPRGPASRWLAAQACRQQGRGPSETWLDAMPTAAGCHTHQMLVRLLQWQAAQRAPKDPF